MRALSIRGTGKSPYTSTPTPWFDKSREVTATSWNPDLGSTRALAAVPDSPAPLERSKSTVPGLPTRASGHRARRARPATPGPCRAALFIDLDNVTITDSQQSASDEVEALLQRIVLAAGPVDWKIAVAPGRTITDFGPSLAKLNLRWQVVPCSPDAADARILSLAEDLHRCGFQRYIIASADGYFADLREFGHLTVIARSGKPTSLRLRAAADELIAA